MGIADMHCDTLCKLVASEERGKGLKENPFQVDLVRMKRSGYIVQNFAVFVDRMDYPKDWERVLLLVDRFRSEMEENAAWISQVRSYQEICDNQAKGKLSALLTVEEGGVCEESAERLYTLYEKGVRMMTLTWNYPNEFAYPASLDARWNGRKERGRGLTSKGRELVQRMEELGILPDLSHLSDEGAREVLACTKRPLVASHSNARAVCDHPRNLPDPLIRQIGERGGCIGLNYFEKFVGRAGEEIWEGLAEHARHIIKVGGEECLGLGSDFDGIAPGEMLKGVQSVPLLWDQLHARGFTERQLEGIFEKNVLRVYREVLHAYKDCRNGQGKVLASEAAVF